MAYPYQAGPTLSPAAQQAISTYQLGAYHSEFKVGLTRHYLTGLIAGLIITLLFGFILINTGNDSSNVLLILFLLGLILLLYYVVDFLIHMSWRVYLCEQGFLLMKGSQADPFRWDQVQAMWQQVTKHYRNGIYTGTTHKYTIQRLDGHKIIFNDKFKQVEKLGDALSDAITTFMLPRALASYNAGQVLNFGPLSVSQQGVSNGKETLPWHEIKEFGVNRGIVSVRKEGKWFNWSTISVAKIPNFFVFMSLTRSILSQVRR
ncbi:hypothetical protein KSD_90910 [Ktedonobacter sp. SOSP1-85]|uniref:DUF6585 family protein n=1 Tax=Ktedonobacter sp. SOSP1-85 TaxID=2778367 RepID=UPI00191648EF|nr:DUF6585 family protein [Ktedonobacter sp. SOSP1-85]GHO81320.1 hypothetical protein KSD_90910 [Ktedonobacter sp. SOSP1-85]